MAEAAKDKKTTAKPAATNNAAVTDDAAVTDETSVTDETAEVGENVPVPVTMKSAFAAALERKKQTGQARSAHLDGHGGVSGGTSSHKATRTFRRKSGSA